MSPLWTWVVIALVAGAWAYGNWRMLRADGDNEVDQ